MSALLPTVQEVTGREVAVWKKPRRKVPPVGLAQRFAYSLSKRILGLAGRYKRLKDKPTQMELSMKRKGRTLQEIRMNAIERQAADLKWEMSQDGLLDFLKNMEFNRAHYKQLHAPKMDLMGEVGAIAGERNRLGYRHFTGASYDHDV